MENGCQNCGDKTDLYECVNCLELFCNCCLTSEDICGECNNDIELDKEIAREEQYEAFKYYEEDLDFYEEDEDYE